MEISQQKVDGTCDHGPERESPPRSAAGPGGASKRIFYGFGAVAFLIIVAELFSGVFLAMFYQPSPADALKSVRFIDESIALGSFFRSLHGWGALLIPCVIFFHIISVVYRGAYRAPRQFNWYIGILLLLLVAAFIVTGYLLPWDFRSYWAVITMTNWLEDLPLFSGILHWLLYGDATRGMVPVGRWFTVHAVVLPLLTGLCLAAHFTLFRKHGSVMPKE